MISKLCRVFLLRPSFDLLVDSLLQKGLEATVVDCSLKAGIPCKPMLAKVAHGAIRAGVEEAVAAGGQVPRRARRSR